MPHKDEGMREIKGWPLGQEQSTLSGDTCVSMYKRKYGIEVYVYQIKIHQVISNECTWDAPNYDGCAWQVINMCNANSNLINSLEWKKICISERGKVLTGKYSHYCYEWVGATVDETCGEFDCCMCDFNCKDSTCEFFGWTRDKKPESLWSKLEKIAATTQYIVGGIRWV